MRDWFEGGFFGGLAAAAAEEEEEEEEEEEGMVVKLRPARSSMFTDAVRRTWTSGKQINFNYFCSRRSKLTFWENEKCRNGHSYGLILSFKSNAMQ